MCLFIHRICGCGSALMSSNKACTTPQGRETLLELMELGSSHKLAAWPEHKTVYEHITTVKRMYETRCICSGSSHERASYADSARAADRDRLEAHRESGSLLMLTRSAMYLFTERDGVQKSERVADDGGMQSGTGPAHGVTKSLNTMMLLAACGCTVEKEVYEPVSPFEVSAPDQFECMEWRSQIHVGPMCRRCAMASAVERERRQTENAKVDRDLARAMANIGQLGLGPQSIEPDVGKAIDSFKNFRI